MRKILAVRLRRRVIEPVIESKNILVIRLRSIGDVVLTLPALSVLRDNFPQAKITFLTSLENAPLLRGFSQVHETIALDRDALRGLNLLRIGGGLFRLVRQLRAGKFSLCVDLQSNGESGWLARLTGAPERWGVVDKPGRRWAFTRSAACDLRVHAAERHLQLLEFCGCKISGSANYFILPADALEMARGFLSSQNIAAEQPMMYVQPFTSSPHKNWPLEKYLSLAELWRARGWQVVFGGGPADITALTPAQTAGFAVSAGALMQFSALILGGDTGMLHLAVAQGKRVVMLMNHNCPGRPHPFRHPEWSHLPPVDRDIASLKLETVVAACEAAEA